jgi:hypothetical protein
MRNVSRSTREPAAAAAGAGETFLNRWRVELPIGHFDGVNETRTDGTPAGPIDVRAVGEGRTGVYRWLFLAADGGGTVLVHEGRFDGFRQSALLAKLLARNPTYEAGMALSAGLVMMKGVQGQAERLAREAKAVAARPTGRAPGFAALLDRGMLAIVRSDAAGALVDVSVVERVQAPLATLLGLLRAPERWPTFLPSVREVRVEERDAAGRDYRIAVEAVIVDVESTWRMNDVPGGVDCLALGGDVKGSRYRWDLSSRAGAGGAEETVAVYRGNSHLRESSRILRAMFRFEPWFEHTANVTIGAIFMRAMTARALAVAKQGG